MVLVEPPKQNDHCSAGRRLEVVPNYHVAIVVVTLRVSDIGTNYSSGQCLERQREDRELL
jgi:hypothetical protein